MLFTKESEHSQRFGVAIYPIKRECKEYVPVGGACGDSGIDVEIKRRKLINDANRYNEYLKK